MHAAFVLTRKTALNTVGMSCKMRCDDDHKSTIKPRRPATVCVESQTANIGIGRRCPRSACSGTWRRRSHACAKHHSADNAEVAPRCSLHVSHRTAACSSSCPCHWQSLALGDRCAGTWPTGKQRRCTCASGDAAGTGHQFHCMVVCRRVQVRTKSHTHRRAGTAPLS